MKHSFRREKDEKRRASEERRGVAGGTRRGGEEREGEGRSWRGQTVRGRKRGKVNVLESEHRTSFLSFWTLRVNREDETSVGQYFKHLSSSLALILARQSVIWYET